MDSLGGYISKKLYVETKESGPFGGGDCAGHAPFRSAMNTKVFKTFQEFRAQKVI